MAASCRHGAVSQAELDSQTSFCPDLFQASLFQLEELARGRKPAEGPVFGGTAGAGLSAGIWGRRLEKHRAVGGPQRRE